MDIPESFLPLQVGDDTFANAYESLDAGRRSILKKWIAQFHLFWGRQRIITQTETIDWDAGYTTTTYTHPLAWSLVVLSEAFASPGQLLALIMPMLLSGTRHIFVVREGGNNSSFPVPLLVALELAGQEDIFTGKADELAPMLAQLPESYGTEGKVFCLGEPRLEASFKKQKPGITCWSATKEQKAGIWFDADIVWDVETIIWMLKGTEIHVGGYIPKDLPASCIWKKSRESFEEFVRHDFGALYLPRTKNLPSVTSTSVLGPGQEGGWLWSTISPKTFTRTTTVWHGLAHQDSEEKHGRP